MTSRWGVRSVGKCGVVPALIPGSGIEWTRLAEQTIDRSLSTTQEYDSIYLGDLYPNHEELWSYDRLLVVVRVNQWTADKPSDQNVLFIQTRDNIVANQYSGVTVIEFARKITAAGATYRYWDFITNSAIRTTSDPGRLYARVQSGFPYAINVTHSIYGGRFR